MDYESISSKIGLLPEGPIWDHRFDRLLWVDIDRGELWCAPRGEATSVIWKDSDYLSGVWLAENDSLIVSSGQGIRRLAADGLDLGSVPGAPTLDPRIRFNDGAVDPQGRLVVGTMGRKEPDFTRQLGILYRLSSEGECQALVEGLTISNGVGWSPDGETMYLADTIRRRILIIPYLTSKWPMQADDCDVVTLDALPDGLTVRDDGALIVACITSGYLSILSPEGTPLEKVDLPASCPTACCFGGPALDRLFVTTSTHLLAPDHTEVGAGKVLILTGHGRGRPELAFGSMT